MIYTCAICGDTFEGDLTDAELALQFAAEFPNDSFPLPEDREQVCDGCFNSAEEQARIALAGGYGERQ